MQGGKGQDQQLPGPRKSLLKGGGDEVKRTESKWSGVVRGWGKNLCSSLGTGLGKVEA